MNLELNKMLRKGAIMGAQPAQGEFLSNLFLVRKKDGLALLFEIRGNKEQTYDQMEQRDLPLSSKSHYGYHSTIPAFSTEYSSRQRIKKKNRLSRVASLSQSFSSCFSTTRFSNNRYIWFPPMPPTTQYIAWHPDPSSQGTDAMIQNWNIGLPYAFPPSDMISRVLLKIKQECVPLLILITPAWSIQPRDLELLNLCVREPVLLPQG